MNIVSLKGQNMDLTDAIKTYVEQKLGSVDHLVSGLVPAVEARVEVGKSTHHHKNGPFMRCEVNLVIPGATLRTESEQEDLYAAIDESIGDLKRQLTERKDAMQERHRGPRPDKA